MATIEIIVEHAGKNLSAYMEDAPIFTVGKDLKEIEKNIREAIDFYLEDNPNPSPALTDNYKLVFKIDTATFINYYSGVFTKAALSRITGINERQLWHYAAGVHKPRKKQTEKMQNGIKLLSHELEAIQLV
ncbi:MAG: antitoxin HicB [Bacteroidales bacterium]|nr:antitoxin HicB [Bacteroidales bacterium]